MWSGIDEIHLSNPATSIVGSVIILMLVPRDKQPGIPAELSGYNLANRRGRRPRPDDEPREAECSCNTSARLALASPPRAQCSVAGELGNLRNRSMIRNPTGPLFSGWNCTPKRLALRIAA